MTTTDPSEMLSQDQYARLNALQGVAGLVSPLTVTHPAGLIELANYVIGDDEPFDPVALARKARADIAAESEFVPVGGWEHIGYTDDSGVAETGLTDEVLAERERMAAGDITVSDLAGFVTLPTMAILEDEDGDVWHYRWNGWCYAGNLVRHTCEEIFNDFADRDGKFHFVITNPEVLG
jgi:hypothetical protein